MARTKQTARKVMTGKKGAEAQEEEQEEAYYSDAEPDIGEGLFDDDYEEGQQIKGKSVPQKAGNQLKKLEQFQQQQTKSKGGPFLGKGEQNSYRKMATSEMVIDWNENLSKKELIIADLDQVFREF